MRDNVMRKLFIVYCSLSHCSLFTPAGLGRPADPGLAGKGLVPRHLPGVERAGLEGGGTVPVRAVAVAVAAACQGEDLLLAANPGGASCHPVV